MTKLIDTTPRACPEEARFEVILFPRLFLFRRLITFERVVVLLIVLAGVVQLFRSRLGMAISARLALFLGIFRLGIGQAQQATAKDGNSNQAFNQLHGNSP